MEFFIEILDLVWHQDPIFLFVLFFFFLTRTLNAKYPLESGATVGIFTVWKQALSLCKQVEFLPVNVFLCYCVFFCCFFFGVFFLTGGFMNVKALPWPRSSLQGSNLKLCFNSQTRIMLVYRSRLGQTHAVCSHTEFTVQRVLNCVRG